MKNYIKFTRESFATLEDWKTVLEELGVEGQEEEIYSITIYFNKNEADINYYV